MLPLSFQKGERLKSRKIIAQIFSEGKSIKSYPIRVLWTEIIPSKSNSPVQFSISIPRRSFPKATQRNLLKRRIREAYRLNKPWFYEKLPQSIPQCGLMVIYIAKEILPFQDIENATRKWMEIFTTNKGLNS